MEQVTIGKNNMEDVFGNKLEIGSNVLFMQVGYRFFGMGNIISITNKTCVIEFEGQKVRQFPNQLINVDGILDNKAKLHKIKKITEKLEREDLPRSSSNLVEQIQEIIEKPLL